MSILSTELNSKASEKNKNQKILKNSSGSSAPNGNREGEKTPENATTDTINQPKISVPANGLNQPNASSQHPVIMNPAQTVVHSNSQQFFINPLYAVQNSFPPMMSSSN